MTTPVVNHILPAGSSVGDTAEGPTAGRSFIDIWGRNFRLPPDPDPIGPLGSTNSGLVVADEPVTVSVTFGGVEAEKVEVLSALHLQVVNPITPLEGTAVGNYGEGAVDVVVTNLDDDGDPIVGETVTVTGGFTYRHVKLDATTPSDLLRLIVTFITEMKKQVIPEVVYTTDTDYDSSTGDALNITDLAKVPAIAILGPELPENRFFSLNGRPEEADGDDVEIRRKPRTVDLLFDVVGITSSMKELLNLLAIVNEFMNRNPYLFMLRDPDDSTKGSVQYEFAFSPNGEFKAAKKTSTSNIRTFSGAVVIRGFDIEGFAGFNDADMVREKSKLLTEDPSLDANKING